MLHNNYALRNFIRRQSPQDFPEPRNHIRFTPFAIAEEDQTRF